MHGLASADTLLFEAFRLDLGGLFRLDQGGVAAPVALGSRALDLLRLLVEGKGELVSKDQIMAAVWPGTAVEEANLTVQISTLRCVLDRDRRQGSCIQTIPGRGYRFTRAVTRIETEAPASAATLQQGGVPPLPDKPSLAVMPFQNMSGDPEQEYFADGMVEEITTALSRIRWLFVIARNSSFTYKGQAVDVKQVGRELGVRYVLEGSVRKAGGRVRITAQLIDAASGAHLWADRFDGSLEDVFQLQDKVAINVAGVIEPALQAAEVRRSAARPVHDVTAYDLYLRALATYYPITKDRLLEALELLHQAIAIDPDFAAAHAIVAFCHEQRYLRGGMQEETRIAALRHARLAIAGGDDASALATAGFVVAVCGRDYEAALAAFDRSFALSSSSALALGFSSIVRAWNGDD